MNSEKSMNPLPEKCKHRWTKAENFEKLNAAGQRLVRYFCTVCGMVVETPDLKEFNIIGHGGRRLVLRVPLVELARVMSARTKP